MTNVLLVKEWITYTPAPATGPERGSTLFAQMAGIESQLTGLVGSAAGRKVESWSQGRFGDNAAKGRQGLMAVLQGLWGAPPPAPPPPK